MSFSALYERACALSPDFGAYIALHTPYAEALSAALGSHPAYAGLMTYLASQAPSGLYPYLFEERVIKTTNGAKCRSYLCRFLHASLGVPSQTTKATDKALHIVHIVNTILKSRLQNGDLDFCDDGERKYAKKEEVRINDNPDDLNYPDNPNMGGRIASKFLWPVYHNDALSIKVITSAFVISTEAEDNRRVIDQKTLTSLMLCALAYRLSQCTPSLQATGGAHCDSQPDVLFSFTSPFVNYKAERTTRGVKVALYSGANDPKHSAECAMRKLFARHDVDDPNLLFFAVILAQGAFSDISKPEVANRTGFDHYVFSPCHLRFEDETALTVVGMVIGLKDGMIAHGQAAILSGSKESGLTLTSDPAWTIGEFPNGLTPLLYDGIGSAQDLPDTATLISRHNNFEKDVTDGRYSSCNENSDMSMHVHEMSEIRIVSVNFLAHPHPVFSGSSLHDAYFSDGMICPSIKWAMGIDAKIKRINTYFIQAIDRFSISYSDCAQHCFKKWHPIDKPLLMSLNRRGVDSRRISFLLHEMLTRDNPHVALYKTLRNGMICKNSRDYNLCISLLSLNGAQDAEKRLIQFAQLYPAMFAWLLGRLSSSHAHVLENLNAYSFSGDLTRKRLENEDLTFLYRDCTGYTSSSSDDVSVVDVTAVESAVGDYRHKNTPLDQCALGVFRDVVCGLPVDETLRVLIATSSGVSPRLVSRRLAKRMTQCRLRTKDYSAVKALLDSPQDHALAHVSRFLEISPDLTLTQCMEAHQALISATDIIRRARKGNKAFSRIACNGANVRVLDHRLRKGIFCAAEYRPHGYLDDGDGQGETWEMAQRAVDDVIALSQRVLSFFTKSTLEHFKRWTCADVFEVVGTFSDLADPSLSYRDVTQEDYSPVCLTENFLRVCSEQHLVNDLMTLTEIAHERTDVLQNIKASISSFRLYRPRSVAKNPVRDTWPVLCPKKVYAGVTITCINSTKNLKKEGRDMTHCVGGYTQNAWVGEPILSLSSPTARSTAHLCVTKTTLTDINGKPTSLYELVCIQHRSHHNNQATASHKSALKRFITERNADQKGLGALYREIEKKRKAINAYKSDINVMQHPEEHGTALALHWPQFSFFMRKKRDCPYPVMPVDTFKAIYKARRGKTRKARQIR